MSTLLESDAPVLVTADAVARLTAEIEALRETAVGLNDGYAHSGLTNPRADRITARVDGIEYALTTLLGPSTAYAVTRPGAAAAARTIA